MTHLLLLVIYLAFISLGLPDSLLGAAWPSMYEQMGAQVSWAGIVSMIISGGTIVSSLMSDRLTFRLGPGRVTALSVLLTAIALFGFSISSSFWMLCLWAIPYGLGAGSVDAALNNYVALHYSSRHMSWLHCMWGIGTSVSPYLLSIALTRNLGWATGYRWISLLQIVLTILLFLSLPLWKHRAGVESGSASAPLPLRTVFALPGAKASVISFFAYCAMEATAGLWAASFLTLCRGLSAEEAAGWASLFYVGITIGRLFSGFLTMKFSDKKMIRLGEGIVFFSLLLLLLPFRSTSALSLILLGLGCAPIYPCTIHSTPSHFGADKSQALIGVQMACAYVGCCLMPLLFGFLSNVFSTALFPYYLIFWILLNALTHELLECKAPGTELK